MLFEAIHAQLKYKRNVHCGAKSNVYIHVHVFIYNKATQNGCQKGRKKVDRSMRDWGR